MCVCVCACVRVCIFLTFCTINFVLTFELSFDSMQKIFLNIFQTGKYKFQSFIKNK